MKIKISSPILQAFPSIHYTVILINHVENNRKISNLSQLLRGAAVVAKNELKKADKKDLLARITEIELEDGSTFLEGYLLDSRIKKILNGKDIEGKNNLLNFASYVSLKYLLPIHGFDLDQAEKDYLLEFYQPKKGKKTPELDFLPETRHLVIWFPNLAGWQEEEIDRFVSEINVILNKYLQTQIAEVYHLDAEHPEIDLGYQSERELEYAAKKAEEEASQPLVEVSLAPEADQVLSDISPDEFPSVPHPAEQIKVVLTSILHSSFPELTSLDSTADLGLLVEIDLPKDPSHGDLSTNLAMKLAKTLGQSPQSIAGRLVELIKERHSEMPLLASVETIGPGFINFRLSTQFFQEQLQLIGTQQDRYGLQNLGHSKEIMIEFGSLNIAKPFSAHHLPTTVIGQTLVNLYRSIGYHVTIADFPGDWGTQFGKAIYAYKHWGDQQVVQQSPMAELLKLYVRFHDEAEKNPALEEAAREEFRKLENGDLDNHKLWQWMVDISLQEIDKIYQTLGVKHQRRYPESKYNQSSQELLQRGKDLGLFTEGEKGAFIANLDAEGLPPALVQKSDGTSLYITRDLASIKDRLTSEPALEQLVYVVDVAQTLHFRQLFAVAEKMHRLDSQYPVTEFKHVAYGRMSFGDMNMSTRKGNVIMAQDLIKEAVSRSEKILKEKLAESDEQFAENEIKKLTHGLAVGAIKYAMLTQSPESNFTFDWDKVLSFDGNSAPYLQYTYARSQSILRKAAKLNSQSQSSLESNAGGTPDSKDQISLFSIQDEQKKSAAISSQIDSESALTAFCLPAEQRLLRQLPLFPDKIAASALNYKPNTLSNYLHELAQDFNSFYGSVQVLKTQRPDLLQARLQLVQATAQIIKNGLHILGISVFDRM